jgi:hypothetical protein
MNAAGCYLGIGIVASARAPESSNLKQISEIDAKVEIQGYLHGQSRKVSNDYLVNGH